jgi:uncharacterized iron-regulated protein
MVDAAKSQHRPVHAANAPRAYVRVARLDGYERLESLTAEQRRLFTVPAHLAAGRYRDDFDRVMMPADAELFPPDDVHRRLDAAFRAQQLWDWTMADSIATAVEQGERPVVHVVGRFHVDFHGGTVQALERESMGTRIVVVSFVDEESDALRDEDRGRADFVVYVGASAE